MDCSYTHRIPFLSYPPSPYHRNTAASSTSSHSAVPFSYPPFIASKQAWLASEFENENNYVLQLSNDEKDELDAALVFFKGLGLDGNLVERSNFPLSRLKHVFDALADVLHNGIGFCVIRGIEKGRYSVEDSMVVFLGIQSYIAAGRMRQDEAGNMVVHVLSDTNNSQRSSHVRHSSNDIPFHTDPDADILAFQTRSTAALGGKCILSSGHTIYNELAKSRPDVIHTLAQPDWPFALPHFHQRPILFHCNSRIIFSFTRIALTGSALYPRPSSIPSLSPQQLEALNILCETAEKHRLEIITKAGDFHFVNNLALLHRRSSFVDHGAQKRHLVRMHLRNEELGWEIPQPLKRFWDQALDERLDQRWHIEPMPEAFFPLKLGSH